MAAITHLDVCVLSYRNNNRGGRTSRSGFLKCFNLNSKLEFLIIFAGMLMNNNYRLFDISNTFVAHSTEKLERAYLCPLSTPYLVANTSYCDQKKK